MSQNPFIQQPVRNPLSYRQLFELRDAVGDERSVNDFAEFINEQTQSDVAQAGVGGGFGNFLRDLSVRKDRLLESTGLPELSGQAISELSRTLNLDPEQGYDVGKGIPSFLTDVIPLIVGSAIGGPFAVGAGIAGTATLAGGSTYEKTNSPLAGFISAGAAGAMPLAGSLASRFAASKGAGALAQYGASQLGMLGVGELSSQAISKELTGEFFNPFTAQHAFEIGITQLPFTAVDALRFASARNTQRVPNPPDPFTADTPSFEYTPSGSRSRASQSKAVKPTVMDVEWEIVSEPKADATEFNRIAGLIESRQQEQSLLETRERFGRELPEQGVEIPSEGMIRLGTQEAFQADSFAQYEAARARLQELLALRTKVEAMQEPAVNSEVWESDVVESAVISERTPAEIIEKAAVIRRNEPEPVKAVEKVRMAEVNKAEDKIVLERDKLEVREIVNEEAIKTKLKGVKEETANDVLATLFPEQYTRAPRGGVSREDVMRERQITANEEFASYEALAKEPGEVGELLKRGTERFSKLLERAANYATPGREAESSLLMLETFNMWAKKVARNEQGYEGKINYNDLNRMLARKIKTTAMSKLTKEQWLTLKEGEPTDVPGEVMGQQIMMESPVVMKRGNEDVTFWNAKREGARYGKQTHFKSQQEALDWLRNNLEFENPTLLIDKDGWFYSVSKSGKGTNEYWRIRRRIYSASDLGKIFDVSGDEHVAVFNKDFSSEVLEQVDVRTSSLPDEAFEVALKDSEIFSDFSVKEFREFAREAIDIYKTMSESEHGVEIGKVWTKITGQRRMLDTVQEVMGDVMGVLENVGVGMDEVGQLIGPKDRAIIQRAGELDARTGHDALMINKVMRVMGLNEQERSVALNSVMRTVKWFGVDDVKFGQLMANPKVAGVSFRNPGFVNKVFLAPQFASSKSKATRALHFATAHEMSHQLIDAFRNGELTGELAKRVGAFVEYMDGMDGSIRPHVLKGIARDLLPESMRKDADVQKLWNANVTDPVEHMTNVLAMQALGSTTPKSRAALKDFMTFAPKPLADFMHSLMEMLKKAWRAISTRFGNFKEMDLARSQVDSLLKGIDNVLNDVTRINREAMNSLRMLNAEPEGFRGLNADPVTLKDLGLEGSPNALAAMEEAGKMLGVIAKATEPPPQSAARDPRFRGIVMAVQRHQGFVAKAARSAMQAFGADLHAHGLRFPKDTPAFKVLNNKEMREALQFWLAHDESLKMVTTPSDPAVAFRLAQLPADRRLFVEQVRGQVYDSRSLMFKSIATSEREGAVPLVAYLIQGLDPTKAGDVAFNLARKAIKNQESTGNVDIDGFVGRELQRLDKIEQAVNSLVLNIDDMTNQYLQAIGSQRRRDAGDLMRQLNLADHGFLDSTHITAVKPEKGVDSLETHVEWARNSAHTMGQQYLRRLKAYEFSNPSMLSDQSLLEHGHNYIKVYERPIPEIAQQISKWGFVYYVGTNLSSAFTEASQTLMSTFPQMVAEGFGMARSVKLMTEAPKLMIDAISGKNAELHKVFKDMQASDYLGLGSFGTGIEQGVLDFLTPEGFSNATRNKSLASAGLGAAVNTTTTFYRFMTEGNMLAAALMSFKEFRKRGMSYDEALDEAVRFTRQTNMGGGRAGKPVGLHNTENPIWQTAASIFYSLRNYVTSMLWGYVRNFEHGFRGPKTGPTTRGPRSANARKAFYTQLTLQLAAAGVLGLPGVGAALATIENNTDFQPHTGLREFVASLFDDPDSKMLASEIATKGIFAAFDGPDISSRLSMGGAFLGTDELNGINLGALVGPMGSMIETAFNGLKRLDDDPVRAAISVLPPGIKKALQLIADDGQIRDSQGYKILEPSNFERAMMAIGFNPQRLSREREKAKLVDKAQDIARSERSRYYDQLAEMVLAGQAPAARQIMEQNSYIDPTYDVRQTADRVAERIERMTFEYDESRNATGVEAQAVDRVLASYGLTQPSNAARAQLRQQTMNSLGLFTQPASFEDFMLDSVQSNRPLSRRSARFSLDPLTRHLLNL